MNFYTKAIDKLVKKVGEHNLPYVYMVIFLLFLAGMALTTNYGIKKMDERHQQQFQVFEDNIKALEDINKELDVIGRDMDKALKTTKEIHRNMIELERQAKKLSEGLKNDKSR